MIVWRHAVETLLWWRFLMAEQQQQDNGFLRSRLVAPTNNTRGFPWVSCQELPDWIYLVLSVDCRKSFEDWILFKEVNLIYMLSDD
jgi:hypothetical protein